MHFSLPDVRYKEPVQVAFFERLIERVRSLSGVQTAGLVSTAPGQGWGGDFLVSVIEHPPLPKGQGLDLMTRVLIRDTFLLYKFRFCAVESSPPTSA